MANQKADGSMKIFGPHPKDNPNGMNIFYNGSISSLRSNESNGREFSVLTILLRVLVSIYL